MWGPDNRIYFISDRDGRMNLFSTDLTGKDTKQLTTFKDYDIKFPSIGKDAIVFEQAGYIWRYDLANGQAAPVPIDIKEDLASGRSAFVDASKHIQSVSTAPDGQRVIVVARGDLFSVPMKEGTARNLTRTSNAHERDAVWSPDGKWIAYNSDATGENELYVRSQDGKGQPHADNEQRRHLLLPGHLVARQQEAALERSLAAAALCRCRQQGGDAGRPGQGRRDRRLRLVARQPMDRLVAPGGERRRQGLSLFHRRQEDRRPVTDDWYSADNATFSDDGKYLMLTSSRDFKPIFGQTDFSNVYRDLERVYLVTLAKETENPLGPRSDEVGKKKDKDKDKDKDGDKKDADKKDSDKKADDKKADDAKKGRQGQGQGRQEAGRR